LHEKGPSETTNIIEEKETKVFFCKLNALDPSALIAFFEGAELTKNLRRTCIARFTPREE